jgi:hypothetical protein
MCVGEKKSKLSASSINLSSSVSVICVTSHMFCGSWEFPQLQVFGKWEFFIFIKWVKKNEMRMRFWFFQTFYSKKK